MRLLLSSGEHARTAQHGELSDSDVAGLIEAGHIAGRQIRSVFVATLDGAAVGTDWRAGSISGPADQRFLALTRALADVVLVGARTVRAENYGPPKLRPAHAEIRKEHGRGDPPPIAVVSITLDLPDRLLADPRTIVLTTNQSSPERRAALAEQVDVVLAGDDELDLPGAVAALEERGHARISCEGGPTLYAEMLRAGLIDEHLLTYSPMLTAGAAGRITAGPSLDSPAATELVTVLEEDGFLFTHWRS